MVQFLDDREGRAGILVRAGRRLAVMIFHGAELFIAGQRRWREHAQLAELDAATLQDVGLKRADVIAELEKRGWRR